MRYVNVDNHNDAVEEQRKRPTRAEARVVSIRPKLWVVFLATALFVIGLLGYYAYSFLAGLKMSAGDLAKAPGAVVSYVANKDPQVKNQDGRMNIALLGIGGEGHDGPYLTDTMIVASVNIKNGNAVLIPFPRDIWVPSTRSKLNAVYAYGFEKGDKKGLTQIKEELGRMTGMPIHYALRIDFGGFEKALDLLGGIDIVVDNSFVDGMYPIAGKERDMCGNKEIEEKIASESGEIVIKKLVDANNVPIPDDVEPYPCRYEKLVFNKGPLKLDGKTALKYVRSRHGTNGEGSDFARSRRQEKVIAAAKDKLLSAETLLNPSRVSDLLNNFGKSIEMDIEVSEYGEFFKIFQKSKDAKIVSHSISAEGLDALLILPPDRSVYNGAYVLVPKAGANDWSVVQAKVKEWIDESERPPQEASASASIQPSKSP